MEGRLQLLLQPHREAIETIRQLELEAMMRLVGSPENVEAVTAFLEKRDPVFN